jgi:tetratricopeptide (TPR) repeat protein
MKTQSIRKIMFFAIVITFALAAAPRSFAQMRPSYPGTQDVPPPPPPAQQAPTDKTTPATTSAPAAPKIDPVEEADYKAFYDLKPEDADKRIELGDAFIQKYPDSKYAESVYSGLSLAEYSKQQFDKMYANSDKALALNPDDVQMLVIVGWVIPHSYNPNDLNSDALLDKAEKYEKHALASLATFQKPANLTDDQFTAAKAAYESQAHSALGLVYFRKQNWESAVTELTTSTATSTPPDPTDYYVLGVSLGHLNRFPEAADAYTKCAAIPGGLQARCKQQADDAKKQSAAKPATPAKP